MSRKSRRKGGPPEMQAVKACEAQKDNEFFKAVYINDYIGYGVFTSKNFTKGDFLLEYAGELISLEEATEREENYPKEKGSFMFFFQHGGDTKCVDATNETGRMGRLVNDSPKPNSKMKVVIGSSGSPFLCLFALNDIKEGEQVTYDYGVEGLPWRKQELSRHDSESTTCTDVDEHSTSGSKVDKEEEVTRNPLDETVMKKSNIRNLEEELPRGDSESITCSDVDENSTSGSEVDKEEEVTRNPLDETVMKESNIRNLEEELPRRDSESITCSDVDENSTSGSEVDKEEEVTRNPLDETVMKESNIRNLEEGLPRCDSESITCSDVDENSTSGSEVDKEEEVTRNPLDETVMKESNIRNLEEELPRRDSESITCSDVDENSTSGSEVDKEEEVTRNPLDETVMKESNIRNLEEDTVGYASESRYNLSKEPLPSKLGHQRDTDPNFNQEGDIVASAVDINEHQGDVDFKDNKSNVREDDPTLNHSAIPLPAVSERGLVKKQVTQQDIVGYASDSSYNPFEEPIPSELRRQRDKDPDFNQESDMIASPADVSECQLAMDFSENESNTSESEDDPTYNPSATPPPTVSSRKLVKKKQTKVTQQDIVGYASDSSYNPFEEPIPSELRRQRDKDPDFSQESDMIASPADVSECQLAMDFSENESNTSESEDDPTYNPSATPPPTVSSRKLVKKKQTKVTQQDTVGYTCDSSCTPFEEPLPSELRHQRDEDPNFNQEGDTVTSTTGVSERQLAMDFSENESHVSDSEDDLTLNPSAIPLHTVSQGRLAKKKQKVSQQVQLVASDKVSSSSDAKVKKVRVLTSCNKHGNRKWDKHQYCVYCNEPKAKLARHFASMHLDEREVAEAFSFPKFSKQRKDLLQIITNKGNHAHNIEVLEAGSGFLIPFKRPEYSIPPDEFLPCEKCFGYFVSSDLWKHMKNCPAKELKSGRNTGLKSRCTLLLPLPTEVDDGFRKSVLGIMRADKISNTCRNDELILGVGLRLYSKLGAEPHNGQYISQKMRELGRMMEALQEGDSSITRLAQCIKPQHFELVVRAVRICAKYKPSTQKFEIPSLALKLGHSLKKCASIQKVNGLKEGDDRKCKEADRFKELCDLEWADSISSHALSTLQEQKWNKPTILPLSEDIVNLHKYLSQKMVESTESLRKDPDKLSWYQLASASLSKVILFNRRRSGEVQRLKLDDYGRSHSHCNNDVLEGLTEWEKRLCQELCRIEIKGKRGRKVPVLLTSEMKEALDDLVENRNAVGVAHDNIYVFARPNIDAKTCLRGSDCLHKMAVESGAKYPEALTSTKLRKQIATVSQLFCLKNHELDILADFLGHDIRVHRQYYRLPHDTLQMTKVARLLLAMEKGAVNSFKDKKLSDIEMPLDGSCTSSEEEDTDGEDERETNAKSLPGDMHTSGANGSCTSSDEEDTDREDERETNAKNLSGDMHTSGANGGKGYQVPKTKTGDDKDLRKKKGNQSKKKQVRKTCWSLEETNAVKSYFAKNIRLCRVPRKDECDRCQRSLSPLLDGKTWKNIKFKVYSQIQNFKRCSKRRQLAQ